MFNPLYDVRQVRDMKDLLNQSAKLFGERYAFKVKTGTGMYQGITYKEFKSHVDAFGTALLDLGLKDQFIAVIGENRYEWCVTYLSTVNGTGVIVPLDKELPVSEIENLLNRSKASAIVFSGKHEKDMLEISENLPHLKYFINMDKETGDHRFLSYSQLVQKGQALIAQGNRSFLDAEIDAERMSVLIFTSGTTDLAKGVMLSHKNICSDVTQVCSAIYIDCNDSSLSILPIHHTFECTAEFLVLLYNGGCLSFCEGLKHVAKNLKETSPTIIFAVPLLLENMYRKIWEGAAKKKGQKTKLKIALRISNFLLNTFHIDLRRKLFKQIHDNIGGKVRLIISGAAAIDPGVSKGFHSMGFLVLQGYGLTECSPIVTVNREKTFRNDSIGQPIPGVEVKIENAGSDGIGELAVRGEIVMLGYFENQAATDRIMKDGWLYTGDLGRMDESGFCYITGRKKNVIVTKNGKNIFPEEVEAYLNKSPYIQESLIWGKYDEVSGETYVHAQIFPELDKIKEKLKSSEVTDEEVFKIVNSEVKSVNKNMPLYKRIREFTIRENEFEKTTTKKIKRYVEKVG